MKTYLRKALRSCITRARSSSLARWLREEDGKVVAIDAASNESYGTFVDDTGEHFPLIRGYRDRIKPEWRLMFTKPAQTLTPKEQVNVPKGARASISDLSRFLRQCGIHNQADWKALEIGCYTGSRSFALAVELGCEVKAIDLPEYYVQQQSGVALNQDSLKTETARLASMRNATKDAFRAAGVDEAVLDKVRFLEEDASRTSFPENSLDMVVSWEVLEHVRDPQAVFRELYRILRPGGIAFHEYNPFFCIEGGHSLCTLDIPFGHARLSTEGFQSYVTRYRPDEAAVDLQFFQHNLNRMTLADLRQALASTGYEQLAIVEWPTAEDLSEIDADTLRQVKRHHPSAVINDLIVRRVWVLVRKPNSVLS